MTDYYDIDRLSFSKLFLLNETPKHFTWFKDAQPSTKEMDFGNVVHTLVLEESKFNDRYEIDSRIIIPTPVKKKKLTKKQLSEMTDHDIKEYRKPEYEMLNLNLRLQYHREWLEDFDKKIISSEDYQRAVEMKKSLLNDFETSLILSSATGYENEYFYEFGNIPMKSKIDIVGEKFLADLKTIKTGIINNNRKLYWTIISRGYDIQAALYVFASGLNISEYHLLFVEKKPPFATRMVTLNQSDLSAGWEKFLILFDKYLKYKNGKLDKNMSYENIKFSELYDA